MRILILGGSGFLGSHLVEAAISRGHELTLFNRGQTHPERFPEVPTIHGDRDPQIGAGLTGLRERSWDAVIDTSGYVPRIVRASAEMFSPVVKQYVFVSSRSVYRSGADIGADETAELATLENPATETISGETYGGLKALCEQAADAVMPGRVANIRAGLIVGPRDETDRFTYWPVRVARGGEVLAPGDGKTPVQFIDARDLAAFLVTVVERGLHGAFNAIGPERELTMSAMLEACKLAAPASNATFTWVDQKVLLAMDVKPWSDLPVWIPDTPEHAGFMRTNNAKAVAAGLRFRPVAETARDTLAWFDQAQPDAATRSLKAGLTPEREASILQTWHKSDERNSS